MLHADFMDSASDDINTFVVRSTWKCGAFRADFEMGDEITANNNLPGYQSVDWG